MKDYLQRVKVEKKKNVNRKDFTGAGLFLKK
jgi:hypothetical protein